MGWLAALLLVFLFIGTIGLGIGNSLYSDDRLRLAVEACEQHRGVQAVQPDVTLEGSPWVLCRDGHIDPLERND